MEELQGSPGLPQKFYSHPRMLQIFRLSETILGLLYSYMLKLFSESWDTLDYPGIPIVSWQIFQITYIHLYRISQLPKISGLLHYVVVT